MKHGITSFDVGQKSVAQALAFGGPLDKAGDVDHVEECGNFTAK